MIRLACVSTDEEPRRRDSSRQTSDERRSQATDGRRIEWIAPGDAADTVSTEEARSHRLPGQWAPPTMRTRTMAGSMRVTPASRVASART